MTRNIQTITPETLPRITFKSQPVITTAILAQLYCTGKTNIIKNFNKNKIRFIKGEHYFRLNRNEIDCLRMSITESNEPIFPPKAPMAILWTERGAARHAKMLGTDQAWNVFDRLEESYFDKCKDIAPQTINKDQQRKIQELVSSKVSELGLSNQSYHTIYGSLKSKFRIPSYKDLPAVKFNEAVKYINNYHVMRVENKSSMIDPGMMDILSRCKGKHLLNVYILLGAIATGRDYTMSINQVN